MARKKVEGIKLPTAPGWMVTYGDMMSLLLVFFVMVVAFSTIEIEKFRAAMGSFRGALMPWQPAPTGLSLIEAPVVNIADEIFEEAAMEIVARIEEEQLTEYIEVHQVHGGIKIVFSDPALFDEGRDDLKPKALPILSKVAQVAQDLDVGEIMIEGHTDDTPISTPRFPSNWELSAARALRVLKFFQSAGFPPQRLVAVGYGEYRPRVKVPFTASEKEKAPNRRVEIFLNMKKQELESMSPYGGRTGRETWVE